MRSHVTTSNWCDENMWSEITQPKITRSLDRDPSPSISLVQQHPTSKDQDHEISRLRPQQIISHFQRHHTSHVIPTSKSQIPGGKFTHYKTGRGRCNLMSRHFVALTRSCVLRSCDLRYQEISPQKRVRSDFPTLCDFWLCASGRRDLHRSYRPLD